ncbi:MAG: hypothetical protein SVW57_11340 [Thermodesulfobacteriota bacterium]|nr:hypothetical protein [Thermodesulfobacteriota bacterium]
MLDVGAADEEYSPFDNYLEKKYPYRTRSTALSIHSLKHFKVTHPEVCDANYSGKRFAFNEKQLDVGFSNAVVEHVGDFDVQLYFIMEINKVSQQFGFTTAAKEFAIEVHTYFLFIHWLNKDMFNKAVIY